MRYVIEAGRLDSLFRRSVLVSWVALAILLATTGYLHRSGKLPWGHGNEIVYPNFVWSIALACFGAAGFMVGVGIAICMARKEQKPEGDTQ